MIKEEIKKSDDSKEIDCENMEHIIIKIPKYCYSLNVNAEFLTSEDLSNEHAVQKAKMVMGYDEIQEARKDFLENVEDGDDYDAVFTITDKGKAWLDMYNDLHGVEDDEDEDDDC